MDVVEVGAPRTFSQMRDKRRAIERSLERYRQRERELQATERRDQRYERELRSVTLSRMSIENLLLRWEAQ